MAKIRPVERSSTWAAREAAAPLSREIALAGATAGLLGGLLMAAWALVVAAGAGAGFLFPLRLVGATVLGERGLVGGAPSAFTALAVHFTLSVALGVLFATMLGRNVSTSLSIAAGLAYGLGIFFVAAAVVLPVVNPIAAGHVRNVPSSWIAGHALFGLGVATAPALRRQHVARALRGGGRSG